MKFSAPHEVAVKVASWRWDHVGVYITIIIFVVVSGLAKVGKLKRAKVLYFDIIERSNLFCSLPPCRIHIITSSRVVVSEGPFIAPHLASYDE